MSERVTVERPDTRPAWYVRVGGKLVGVVFRKGAAFQAVREGSGQPERGTFSSRDAAAKALARLAGFQDLDAVVAEEDQPRRMSRP